MTAPEEKLEEQQVATKGSIEGHLKSFTPLQMLFLSRLEKLLEAKNTCRYQLSGEKWLFDAVSRAIYSTLRDSMDVGVGDEAKAILRREHRAN